MTYDNIHRFFLRIMANRGVLSMTESLKVLNAFTELKNSETYVLKLVDEINKEIKSFKQRIIVVHDKNTESCEKSLIFINSVADKATKAQNIFKEKECKYFMKLIEEIISTESKELNYRDALIDLTQFSLTKKEAQVLIDRWCKLFYLKKETRKENEEETGKEKTIEYITLGLRGIYEFVTYFTDNLSHLVKNCQICKDIVIMGCHCTICSKALHKPCLDIHMENKHSDITNITDDSLTEDQQDISSISTDKEEDLLKSESDLDYNEPVPRKRIRIYSTDSDSN